MTGPAKGPDVSPNIRSYQGLTYPETPGSGRAITMPNTSITALDGPAVGDGLPRAQLPYFTTAMPLDAPMPPSSTMPTPSTDVVPGTTLIAESPIAPSAAAGLVYRVQMPAR